MLIIYSKILNVFFTLKKFVISVWFYKYQELNLILEQKDQLHYFTLTANIQSLIIRSFIITLILVSVTMISLITHSTIMEVKLKKLESSTEFSELKRKQIIDTLFMLENKATDPTTSELFKMAKAYRNRNDKMNFLIDQSVEELKLANQALVLGLQLSGVTKSKLKKIQQNALIAIGGPAETDDYDDSLNQSLKNYEYNMRKLNSIRKIYHSIPVSDPVEKAIVVSKFGLRKHPITRRTVMHKGLDLAPTSDYFAKATLDGVVDDVGYDGNGYGNFISILHDNNIRTTYAHLKKINVLKGEELRKGFVIGEIGNTGSSTGIHLHYEISLDNVKLNPSVIIEMAKYVK